jgi:hypothetical protein
MIQQFDFPLIWKELSTLTYQEIIQHENIFKYETNGYFVFCKFENDPKCCLSLSAWEILTLSILQENAWSLNAAYQTVKIGLFSIWCICSKFS